MIEPRAAAVALAVALAPAVVHAQEAGEQGQGKPAERATVAETLFDKAKALMAEGRYDEACPMLAESQRIDPASGTLLTLGLCHERQGKTATAWAEFKDAQARSVKDGDPDREAVAKAHAEALEPTLSRITLRVGPAVAATEGLALMRDGVALGRPTWGLAVPVDPGEHKIEATAPGRRAWSSSVRIDPRAAVEIDIPGLALLPPPKDKDRGRAPASRWTPRFVAGLGVTALGVAGLGVGTFYGVRALTKQAEADDRCDGKTVCNDDVGLAANDSARSSALVADFMLPIGLAATAVGVLLLLTSSDRRATAAWRPDVAPRRASFGLERAF